MKNLIIVCVMLFSISGFAGVCERSSDIKESIERVTKKSCGQITDTDLESGNIPIFVGS